MKKIRLMFTVVAALLVASTAVFYSCTEDEYNFNDIEPIVLFIDGPSSMVPAHGLTEFPFEYKVPIRAGSTYAWSFSDSKWGGTLTQDPERPHVAYAVYNQSDADTAAVIQVIETTMGGKSSPVKELKVELLAFCPYDMDVLEGNWSGTSDANDDPLVATATGAPNELIVKGLAGFVNFSWGENWVEGDGSCLLEFSCGGVVTIKNQWIGDSDYPDVYMIEGTGTYDENNHTISLDYEVFYDAGGASAGKYSTVLTKNAKSVVKNNDVIPAKK